MERKTPKVLLIDDDPGFVDVYTRAFAQTGIAFSTAFNGIEAIDKAKREKPRLILLDIMMPLLNGFDVLKRLKEDKSTTKIPVWMITNLNEEVSKKISASLGAEDYIVKSETTPLTVCERINSFLAKIT